MRNAFSCHHESTIMILCHRVGKLIHTCFQLRNSWQWFHLFIPICWFYHFSVIMGVIIDFIILVLSWVLLWLLSFMLSYCNGKTQFGTWNGWRCFARQWDRDILPMFRRALGWDLGTRREIPIPHTCLHYVLCVLIVYLLILYFMYLYFFLQMLISRQRLQ